MADSTPSKRRGMPWHTVLEFLLHTTTKIGAVFMENTTTSPDVLERFLRYVQTVSYTHLTLPTIA